MSDYTPTTDEVRQYWAESGEGFVSTGERYTEFDRWLAAHDRQVAEKAWGEGYRAGVEDERTSACLRVGIGEGGIAYPDRSNPYREGADDRG